MAGARVDRRLAAILAADVVGYSRLIERDEAATLERLKELRKTFIEPLIAEHKGRVVKLMGDGALCEFGSVVDAVACAIAVQRAVAERQAEVPEEQRIRFRIGINLGDVVSDEGDLLGDGVNVAARLEQLAQPGGIVISGTAYDHLQGKVGCGFQDLGAQRVKNIARPVRAYQVVSEPAEVSSAARANSWGRRSRTAIAAPGRRHPAGWQWPTIAAVVALLVIGAGIIGWLRPWQSAGEMTGPTLDTRRVAVLPFANISADAADEYFADGMTEELISQLSKIGRLTVIARTSVMKYKGTSQDIAEIGRALQVGTVLEGSVRKAGNQVRITAQLIDVPSQAHLWSDDYDRELADVFAVQADIAQQVAEALQITLLADERTQIERQGTASVEAHNSYLKGLYFYNQGGTALEKSRTYFELAIEQDPAYAMAYARLADVYSKMPFNSNMPTTEAYANARAAAEKALELDDALAEAHSALASVRIFADRDWPGAEREFQKAIALNPNYAPAHAEYGHKVLSAIMGRYDDALTELQRAQELDPLSVPVSTQTGWVYFHARRWDQSNAQFERTLELGSKSPQPHIGLGMTYAQMGRYEEAIAAFNEAVAVAGDFDFLKGLRGWVLGLAGRPNEARQVLRELEKTAAGQKVDPVVFAYIYVGLGDHDRAIASLRKADEAHSADVIFLRTSAQWDSLRSEPEFIELMKDVGLPTD
jgi:class 3 adenylate cyclase/TolB-like protein/Flp pilus assembly protein TadD